jgi:hypothetical protein
MFQHMSNRYSADSSDEPTALDTAADILSHKICRPAKGYETVSTETATTMRDAND